LPPRVTLTRLLALLSVLVVAQAALATTAGGATLRERLDRALTVQGVSRAQTGAFAFDLRTGQVLYGLHSSLSLQPASAQKLAVALTALDRLGSAYRIPTEVLGMGSQNGSVWRGRLVLKGYGDPSVSRMDMRALALQVRALGIRRVTGGIRGDESYYDQRRTCLGWKPSWYKVESPPLSALVVARAKVERRVADEPALAAAAAFKAALRAVGVTVALAATGGEASEGAPVLARTRSGPLASLVRTMNKQSDNFYAEMLLKHLGRTMRGAGTTFLGNTVVRNELHARGVPMTGLRFADGSGLSRRDRFTARALAALLFSAWSDAVVKRPFVASLPRAGLDGTLEDRMESRPARGRVRAKTGTTQTASSLSGYVADRYVFSVVQNGRSLPWWWARRAQDRFAQLLAGAAG
jgi:serine-type D-Ala-D-Ala carboxypeptidase/endopeptidase (penicillin-binding protein 4)